MYTDIHEEVLHTANDNITRFKRYGKIIHKIKSGDDVAQIGKINDENVYLVFYPDGEYDRFENRPVIYRAGWFGPELPLLDTSKPNKAVLRSKTTVIKRDAESKILSEEKVEAAEIKLPRARKKAAPKVKPEVASWFGLLGVEPPKPTAKKPAAKKPASKKATSSTKH